MKTKIFLYAILMLLAANAANAEKYFVLDANYIAGSVTFNSIHLKESDRAVRQTDGSGFLIKTVSFENSDIKKIYYNLSENKNYLIYIPYDENAARIEVYNLQNSKIMDVDVSSFANTCGNSICEGHESHESCTKDCSSGSKDDFCDEIKDGICDPDCTPKLDADCQTGTNASESITKSPKLQDKNIIEEQTEKPSYFLWILFGLIFMIIVLLFLFIKKQKENRTIGVLKPYILQNMQRGFTLEQIKQVLFREGYSEKEVDKAVKSI